MFGWCVARNAAAFQFLLKKANESQPKPRVSKVCYSKQPLHNSHLRTNHGHPTAQITATSHSFFRPSISIEQSPEQVRPIIRLKSIARDYLLPQWISQPRLKIFFLSDEVTVFEAKNQRFDNWTECDRTATVRPIIDLPQ